MPRGSRLIVKFTFLDVVSSEDEQPTICRASTDSKLCMASNERWANYTPGSSTAASSERGELSDTEDGSHRAPGTPLSAGAAPAAAPAASSASASMPHGPRDGPSAAAAGTPIVRGPGKARVDKRTTLMLRNLPNNYTRDMLLQMLDDEGFKGCFDFVYLPIDFSHGCGLGYAFVNLVTHELVPRFRAAFEGYTNWVLPTSKVCQVTWSDPHQGLKANVKRYRNSPVMHPSVPDEYKPCLFEAGKRVPFPVASRPLCRPHKRA